MISTMIVCTNTRYIYIYMHTHVYIYIYMYICMYIHMHTYLLGMIVVTIISLLLKAALEAQGVDWGFLAEEVAGLPGNPALPRRPVRLDRTGSQHDYTIPMAKFDNTYTYIYIYIHIHVCVEREREILMCLYYIYIYICIHAYIYIYTYIHTYVYLCGMCLMNNIL